MKLQKDKRKAFLVLSALGTLLALNGVAHATYNYCNWNNSCTGNSGTPNFKPAHFPHHSPKKVKLGKALFFDKILSGNKNISCATCHHTLTDTGDRLSLPVGEGGRGLGITRNTGKGKHKIHARVPRNAPPLFNLGATSVFHTMFHDGRVQANPNHPSGFDTPIGDKFPHGLESALAAQAIFPITSPEEMAGQQGENPVANAAVNGNITGPKGVWSRLVNRLKKNQRYVSLFKAAFPHKIHSAKDITIVDVGNAIAAYEGTAFRADNSPFDRYLKGNHKAMSDNAKAGMNLFYGKAQCSSCHSGIFQTDMQFHSIGMIQIGPGRGDGPQGIDDFGRHQVTKKQVDKYRFRTPTLRNVALTAPWGHAGAYDSLKAIIRHHLNPHQALDNYNRSQAILPSRKDLNSLDFRALDNHNLQQRKKQSVEITPIHLSNAEINRIIDFLNALTDPGSIDLQDVTPTSVPSRLRLFE